MVTHEPRWLQKVFHVYLADDKPQGGKILFKKPIKRTAEEENVNSSTSKAKKLKDAVVVNREKVSSVKDSRLLSFDQDEDEEDWPMSFALSLCKYILCVGGLF